jgi:hypothetical protein
MVKIHTGLVVFASAMVMVGCTSQVGGSAGGSTPTGAPGTSTSSAGSSSKAPLPVRPGVIKLDALDPCKALTATQMNEIGVAKSKRSDGDLVKKGTAPICLYTPNPATFSYEVGLVANEGVGYWRSGSGNVDRKEVQVAGYDAIRTNLIGQKDACSFWVDVADGQMVYVNYLPIDDMSLDAVCGNAQKGTELALATLKTLA